MRRRHVEPNGETSKAGSCFMTLSIAVAGTIFARSMPNRSDERNKKIFDAVFLRERTE